MDYIEHLFVNFIYQNKNDNFSVFTSTLKKEIDMLKNHYLIKIKTIYVAINDFLYLTDQQLIIFLNLIKQFNSCNLIEYSFEVGYHSFLKEQLLILKNFNVNRLVWKVRTFNNNLLFKINKEFNSAHLITLIKSSYNIGFKNFSIDLEDNILEQTKNDIISDLKITLSLKAPHISYQSNSDSYNYENKKIISKFLKCFNYQNYEFFSFALFENNYSQQTLGYLNLKNWYGIGPNASSFGKYDNRIISVVNTDKIPWNNKIEIITKKMYYQFLITQGLMLKKGILLENEQLAAINFFWLSINNLIDKKYLQIKNNYLKTTNKGWDLLNYLLIDIIKYK